MPVAQGADIPYAAFRQANKIPFALKLPLMFIQTWKKLLCSEETFYHLLARLVLFATIKRVLGGSAPFQLSYARLVLRVSIMCTFCRTLYLIIFEQFSDVMGVIIGVVQRMACSLTPIVNSLVWHHC